MKNHVNCHLSDHNFNIFFNMNMAPFLLRVFSFLVGEGSVTY